MIVPNTYIRFKNHSSFFHNFRRDDKVLFMGYISNSDDVIILGDYGVRTIHINWEDWEVCEK